MINTKEFINGYMSKNIKKIFNVISDEIFNNAEEIRIRLNKPLYLKGTYKEYFMNENGVCDISKAYCPNKEDMKEIIEFISDFSLYAFEDELKNGFIPLSNGVRVGICGKVVFENGQVKNVKNISSFNFRIPKNIEGCCKNIIDFITYPKIFHTLIVSAPCCGKTTMLRDIIKTLSNGIIGKFEGVSVGVADERSEIACNFFGSNIKDLGLRTDIIEGGKKDSSIYMLLRSMSPRVIAFDEIGNLNEVLAVCDAINSGVKVICTIHSDNIDDLKERYIFKEMFKRNIFERYIVLSNKNGAGTLEGVYDKNFVKIG